MTTTKTGSGARRWVPYVAIVAIVVIAGVAFAVTRSGDGDDDPDAAWEDVPTAFTFEEAVADGVDTSDWKHCDQETGRVSIPLSATPSCVRPRQPDDTVSAGVQGVTDEAVTVVVYVSDPERNALLSAAFGGLSIDTDPDLYEATVVGYTDLFAEYFEMYGRDIDLHFYRGTGAGDDNETARADAIAIATQYEPFAVINGPIQAPAFAQEIAARGIVCVQSCAFAQQQQVALDMQPYLYPLGGLPEQIQYHAAEFVGKQLAHKNAEFAGDESMQGRERVFGYVAYNTEDAYYTPMIREFTDRLRDEYDTEIAVQREHQLDLEVAAERAEAFIAAMKEADVTTVLISGDPLMPGYLSRAATTQDYHPEWVLTSTVFADTDVFARGYDEDQWEHAFGISRNPARGHQDVQQSYMLYQWRYCQAPPSNGYALTISGPLILLRGIHLAGSDLTPESFQAGLFKAAPYGGIPLVALNSRGDHGIWPDLDVGGGDDTTLVFWDPAAEGPSEIGVEGLGMYRYVDGGKRYRPLEWPTEEIPLFDTATAPTLITDFGDVDMLPAYDSPCGGPPAQAPSAMDRDDE